MLIDSHAHLFFDEFKGEVDAVIERARQVGVSYLVNVGTDLNTSRQVIELAKKYPFIFGVVGVHPHDVDKMSDGDLVELEKLATDEKVMAIGEIGLDYFYEHSPKVVQQKRLRDLIQLAHRVKLPLVIHCRGSDKNPEEPFTDIFKILDEEQGWKRGGVFHCYTGDLETARKIVKRGFYISFSGIITFPKSKLLQEVVKGPLLDRFLVETDCPYLAPVPHRGKPNEPAFVCLTAQKIAELQGTSIEDVERITTRNARDLFGLPIELPDERPKIAYRIRNSLYLNITNQCTLACSFCPKFDDWMVKGHYLKLDHDPPKGEIFDAIGDPTLHEEVVFCGYGEPTLALERLKEIARWLKEKGVKTRLNTEGLGNLVHGRNILPELKGLIDAISISLNAPDAKSYAKVCPSKYGESAYPAVKDFIREAKKNIPDVTATVVGLPNLDVTACQKIVEQELKVKFRLRPYDEVG